MDRVKETTDVLIDINRYKAKKIETEDLIKSVCSYFDIIKDEKLTQSDLKFLKYISNVSGIPHYYDLLQTFEQQTNIEEYTLNTLSSLIYESTLYTDNTNKVHKYQMQILDLFEIGKLNRYFLSASTSFGKTHIVFEIIKKMNYKNVVLIFPTIALLSENLEKLILDENYKSFKIHTLSEVNNIAENNLFIYTPERFLSFIEKNILEIKFDFVFVDEVYKIDNQYLIDEQVKENERDIAYRLAVHYSLKGDVDILFAGPYIDFSKPNSPNYNDSFSSFLNQNKIELLDYNGFEIVNKNYINIVGKSDTHFNLEDGLSFKFSSKNKDRLLIDIIRSIKEIKDNAIIYCPLIRQVVSYSKKIINSQLLVNHDTSQYAEFIEHVTRRFDVKWTLIDALKNGIGIHHGLIPKYIQKEIVSLFNNKQLSILLSTTTITEGVNTSAKNLVVIDSMKGDKPLKKFDAKNISGRAGRFMRHYSGRVIVLQNNFMDVINSEPEGIKHKNYDINAEKDEIDLFYSTDEFLTEEDKQRKIQISTEQQNRNIPDSIFEQFKVISRGDKIIIYDRIKLLTPEDFKNIDLLIYTLRVHTNISFEGFQVILNTIRPIVKNKKLISLIDRMILNNNKQKEYSLLSSLVFAYLTSGFKGSVDFKINYQKKSVDTAIRETAEFVYNILKYQVVKYIGVFNIIYKFHLSTTSDAKIEDIPGIERLLVKLEYNALTENGRIASDYGVPSNIVDYYEGNNSSSIKANFDKFEQEVFSRIEKIINQTDGSTNG